MKTRILNLLLIITSLIGYLEWSGDSHAFLFQTEAEILSKFFTDPISVIHPFTVLPMTGQILLLFTLFQKKPGRMLTFIGMGGLALLLAFIFLIGLMSINYKILFSTLPFLTIASLTIRHHRKAK
jgi:hypothetical protein